jgi:hypothetical protein
MKKRNRHTLTGIVALVIGVLVIVFNLTVYDTSFKKLWPSIILLIGMVFFLAYFVTKKTKDRPGILFIATFLALISVPLFIVSFTSKEALQYVWPGFLLAVGIALLSLHYYGRKKGTILVPGMIVVILSLLIWIFYAVRSELGLIIGVVLFLTGALFLTRGMIRENGKPGKDTAEDRGSGEE